MSLRDPHPASTKYRSTGLRTRPKDAIPAPVLRGAKIVHISPQEHSATGIKRFRIPEPFEAVSRSISSDPDRSKCKTRTRSQDRADRSHQQFETLLPVNRQASTQGVPAEAAQADLETETIERTPPLLDTESFQTSKSDPSLHRQSQSCHQHTLLHHEPTRLWKQSLSFSCPQTHVVVNRATLEESSRSGKSAEICLKLVHGSFADKSRRTELAVVNGRAGVRQDTTARSITLERPKLNRTSSGSIDLASHTRGAAALEEPRSAHISLPTSEATIKSTSSREDAATAAMAYDRHHLDGRSAGFHTRPDSIRWEHSTVHPSTRCDGFKEQSGHLFMYPRLRPPFSAHHRHAQDLVAGKASLASSDPHPQKQETDQHLGVEQTLESHCFQSRRIALSRICQKNQNETTLESATFKPCCRNVEQGDEAKTLPALSYEPLQGPSVTTPAFNSPTTCHGSDIGSDIDETRYDTPMTSPCSSPTKSTGPGAWDVSILRQLDGNDGNGDEDESIGTVTARARVESAMIEASKLAEKAGVRLTDNHDRGEGRQHASRSQHNSLDLRVPPLGGGKVLPLSDGKADSYTPLMPASPAKGLVAFPFPDPCKEKTLLDDTSRSASSSRHPSALLRHCERNATPRQRRLMMTGVRSPDRFITSRAATPTKEGLLLEKTLDSRGGQKPIGRNARHQFVSSAVQEDPFGPTPRRSLRMAEQYATLRSPPPVLSLRPASMIGSRVRDAQPTNRLPSSGTVWTVGGSIVTEGVASTSDGRGGRVTSGTSAPYYTADFLRNNEPSEEEVQHGRRLALAMNVDFQRGMLGSGTPGSTVIDGSPNSSERRTWKDGGWEVDGVATPTKVKAKKIKDVPTIPFRVLDAPALRDDYYCSLLAYSHTVECLAVGLGPHVYLWSESRGTTNIPDSLTAPLGTSHVTSVSFSSREGGSAILAIGRADGRITLWSPLDRDPRFDSEQPAPISCVCFRPTVVKRTSLRDSTVTVSTEELLVGDEIGYVYYYSIEWPNQQQRDLFDWHGSMTLLARISCHSQQVCGLAWSPDGETLATGGNDNQLFLFNSKQILRRATSSRANVGAPPVHVRSGSSGSSSNATVTGQGEVLSIAVGQEKQVFTMNAAVKAIAFAPWQPTLVAAGGGSNDRCIHFFHTLSGASLANIDCHAQVTSLVWSEKKREIAATFGFAQPEHPYRVAVFSWPACRMVVGIPWWGEERALYAVAYPRGPSGNQTRDGAGRADAEGQPWYGRRTTEEGCLVVATSDASIKFHEIWTERQDDEGKRRTSWLLGGSQILGGECSPEIEGWSAIR